MVAPPQVTTFLGFIPPFVRQRLLLIPGMLASGYQSLLQVLVCFNLFQVSEVYCCVVFCGVLWCIVMAFSVA